MDKIVMKKIDRETITRIIKGDLSEEEEIKYAECYNKEPGEIWFENLHIEEEFFFWKDIQVDLFLLFRRCQFDQNFSVKGYFRKGICVEDCKMRGLRFFGGYVDNLILKKNKFDSCAIMMGYYGIFEASSNLDYIGISGGCFDRMSIYSSPDSIVSLNGDRTFINKLIIDGNLSKTSLKVDKIMINSLIIGGRLDENCILEFEHLTLNTVHLVSMKNRGKILMNDIKGTNEEIIPSNKIVRDFLKDNKLKVKDVNLKKNEDWISVHDLMLDREHHLYPLLLGYCFKKNESKNEPSMFFESAQLGNMEFKNVRLNSFAKIEVVDTELSVIKTFNSVFPTKNVVGEPHLLYEVFNDLFTVAKNKNNKSEQSEYYQASKEALLRACLKQGWLRKGPSIVSLSISKIYSNYGTRWTQSLFVSILLSLFLFGISLIFIDNNISSEQFFVYYLRSLNPTHEITFMDSCNFKYSENAVFVTLNLFERIFIGIGIYEMILSFRKYVRN